MAQVWVDATQCHDDPAAPGEGVRADPMGTDLESEVSGAEVTFLLLLMWFALDYRIKNLKGTKMTDDDDTQVYRSELKAAVKAAVAAEREACAKVCDDTFYSVQAAEIIRARGETK